LLKKAGLPVKIKGVSLKDIIGAHYCDKKFIGEKNRFVLLEAIGKVRIQENVPLKAIEEAIDSRV
jgi:3-dehydroquinate synthetase